MPRRSLAVGLLGLGCASCSLLFPGSNYTNGHGIGGSSATSSAVSGASTSATSTGSGPAVAKRVYIAGGLHDKPPPVTPCCFDGYVTSVSFADLTTDGVIGPWREANPLIDRGIYYGQIINKSLVVFEVGSVDVQMTAGTLLSAPLTPDGVGTWGYAYDMPSYNFGYLSGTLGPLAGYVVGGLETPTGMPYVYHGDVTYSAVNAKPIPATLGAHTTTMSLGTQRHDTSVIENGGYLYVVGGAGQTGDLASVEFAPVVGQDGNLGMFGPTSPLQTASGAYPVENPTLCASQAGFLYVVGGSTNGKPLDVILVSKIDPANGKLSAWVGAPQITKLDTPLLNARCFVEGQRLFVLGGQGATAMTDVVTSIAVNADGTLGPTWIKSDSRLDFPRSQFALAVADPP